MTVELLKKDQLSKVEDAGKFESGIDEWLWFLVHGDEIDPESAGFSHFREPVREAVEIMAGFT